MELDRGGSAGAAGSAVTRRLSRTSGGRAGSTISRAASVSNAPRYSSGGGGGGGTVRSYSAPRVAANSSGRYSAPAPPPAARAGGGAIPSIKAFLGHDTGYLQGGRQLSKSLADFLADVGRRRGSLTSQYGLSTKAMGDQKVKDLQGIEEDYGSRGLQKSGLYAKAVGDYNTEYGQRLTDLQRQQNEALTGLNAQTSQFKSQQNLSKQALKEAAIRRRAEQYGV